MVITGRLKLAVFHYLQCPKFGVGERDTASKKYLQWNKNSLKRRQKGTDMKKGRHEAKKRMQGKNLFHSLRFQVPSYEEAGKQIFLKSKHFGYISFFREGKMRNSNGKSCFCSR